MNENNNNNPPQTMTSSQSLKELKKVNEVGDYSLNMIRHKIFYPALKIPEKTKGGKNIEIMLPPPINVTVNFSNGILDQTDMNILTAIIHNSKKITKDRQFEQNGLYFFMPRTVLETLNISTKHHQWLWDKLKWMKTRDVIVVNNGYKVHTSIITKFGYPKDPEKARENIHYNPKKLPSTAFGVNVPAFVLFGIEFHAYFLLSSINIFLPTDDLKKILLIRNGYVQMILKYILSQKPRYAINVDKAIKNICLDGLSDRMIKDIKISIRKDSEIFNYFNIELKKTNKGEFFIYKSKPENLFFTVPTK